MRDEVKLSKGVCLRGLFFDGDGKSESLDPALEPLCLNGRIVTAVEVVGAGVLVEGARAKDPPQINSRESKLSVWSCCLRDWPGSSTLCCRI